MHTRFVLPGVIFAVLLPACSLPHWTSHAALRHGHAEEAPTTPSASAELFELERTWAESMAWQDPFTLDRLLAPDFQELSSGDMTHALSRRYWIENTVQEMEFGSVTVSGMTCDQIGDTAVVRLEMLLEDCFWLGQPCARRWMVTDTWQRRDGRWQAVSRVRESVRGGF